MFHTGCKPFLCVLAGVMILEYRNFMLDSFHPINNRLFLVLGLLCDLLWSDPDKDIQGWGENDRGVSFTFGSDIVGKFLNKHDLDLICRAHQVYTFYHWPFLAFVIRAPIRSQSWKALHVVLKFRILAHKRL